MGVPERRQTSESESGRRRAGVAKERGAGSARRSAEKVFVDEMDGHVDVEGDVVEFETVDVVVVHLEEVIEHEVGLGDFHATDLGDNVKDTGHLGRDHKSRALVADRGNVRVDDDTRLDEHLVLELDGCELVALVDGLLGLAKQMLSLPARCCCCRFRFRFRSSGRVRSRSRCKDESESENRKETGKEEKRNRL